MHGCVTVYAAILVPPIIPTLPQSSCSVKYLEHRMATDVIQFVPFKSFADASFFRELSDKKLNELQLSESGVPLAAQYSVPVAGDRIPALSVSALSYDIGKVSENCKNSVPVSYVAPGSITNVNTLEKFKELDKVALIREEGMSLVDAILNGAVAEDPSRLCSFHIAAFSDLKKYKFYYWFAFPALPVPVKLRGIRQVVDSQPLSMAISHFAETQQLNQWGFFALKKQEEGTFVASPLKEIVNSSQSLNDTTLFGFIDPSTIQNVPSWPLRNYLAFLASLNLINKNISILCYRDHAHIDIDTKSFWIDVSLPDSSTITPELASKTTGWERNSNGKLVPKFSDLGSLINPTQLADQAVDLNLKLMKWRIAPTLDLDTIKNQKCLLLGAGTLGSYISRGLLGWGVRKITFVDSGKVSFSNPVRQPLYKFKDCLNGGSDKAKTAAEALREIYPSVETEGISIEIPMAGHSVTNEIRQKEEYDKMVELIEAHDVVFLLMDSRESRWLPTVICSALSKQVINVALGFDTYLVMRHGLRPDSNSSPHLGCYYCNDVVAPIDSVSGQTLDQMCTVTRPGIAMAASASAVELLASVLQHPSKGLAPPYKGDELPETSEAPSSLSILPHQIRGFLHNFNSMKIWGPAYPNCSACSEPIVNAWRQGGWEFVKEALNNPEMVSEISGLSEIQRQAEKLADIGFASEDDWE